MPALAADLSYGVRRTPGSRPLPDPRSPSPTQTPSTSIPRPPRSPPPARTGPRRPSLREKDVFALTASGSQQPGKYSELRGEKKVLLAFGFLAFLAAGWELSPWGQREQECGVTGGSVRCAQPCHILPKSRRPGGRTPCASAGGLERGGSAAASVGEGSNRK